MHKYWELIAVIGDSEDIIFGDYDKYVVLKELENEKDNLVEEGYSQIIVQARLVEQGPDIKKVKVKDLKKGQVFKRKMESSKAYERAEYDRSEKRYACEDLNDISRAIYLKGDTLVYPW
tara:strand:+ start:253 stop:609 length:357 start_codon:yes stop_codon:yes gene_type:complete